jgi:mono/diheme cytochrome c family protein
VCGFGAIVGSWVAFGPRDLSFGQPPVKTTPDVTVGKQLYANNCAACHGDKGDGNGPMARFLYPRPRNFGEGKFRIVSTLNGKPTDEDLLTVINRGMPGSAMFPFRHLSSDEKLALVAYLRELTREAFVDYVKKQAAAMDDTITDEEARQAAITQLTPGERLSFPDDLAKTSAESIARGAKSYAATCAACHGTTGKGDGVQAQKNDDGTATRPRDLTRGIFKGSRDPKSIYARIMLGMPGSPMPSSIQSLRPNEAADLVHFLLSLSAPDATAKVEQQRTAIVAARTSGALPESGDDAAWKAAFAVPVVLTPLWWRDYEEPDFHVSAMHDGKSLAIRLTWHDNSPNKVIERPEDFLDMAAVQFCSKKPEPFLGMGAEKGTVDLWLWRAGQQAPATPGKGPLDDYPFDKPNYQQLLKGGGKPPDFLTARGAGNPNFKTGDSSNLAAKGAGSTTFLPPASQLVKANATWKDGQWTVVLRRPLAIPPEGLSFAPGKNYSIAFAVWDGAVRDRNGQKMVSIWYDLKLED